MSPLMLVLIAPVYAQDPAVQHHVDQAKLFIKKQWYIDAQAELDAALETPAGQSSYEVHWLLAQVSYEMLDAERAWTLAQQAANLTNDPDQALQASQLAESLRATFGVVEIVPPQRGMQSRLQLEVTGILLDPELKRFVDRLALDWTHPKELPLRVALPMGEYAVQGIPFSAVPGEVARVELPLNALGAKGFAALQVSRLELSSGVGVLFGARVANLRPSVETQLGVTIPVSGWLLGMTGDWAYRSYNTDGGTSVSEPLSFAVGVRLGREVMVGGPLAVRPSVGYRFGSVPGVGLDCAEGAESLTCAPLDDHAAGTVLVYANSPAHIPYAEISIDWRKAGRTTATGVGVRMAYEQPIGVLRSPAQAELQEDGTLLEYSAEPTLWTSPAVRMMANVSLAF